MASGRSRSRSRRRRVGRLGPSLPEPAPAHQFESARDVGCWTIRGLATARVRGLDRADAAADGRDRGLVAERPGATGHRAASRRPAGRRQPAGVDLVPLIRPGAGCTAAGWSTGRLERGGGAADGAGRDHRGGRGQDADRQQHPAVVAVRLAACPAGLAPVAGRGSDRPGRRRSAAGSGRRAGACGRAGCGRRTPGCRRRRAWWAGRRARRRQRRRHRQAGQPVQQPGRQRRARGGPQHHRGLALAPAPPRRIRRTRRSACGPGRSRYRTARRRRRPPPRPRTGAASRIRRGTVI